MALTKIPSSGLTANITLGNVIVAGTIVNSVGTAYIAGTGAVGYTGSAGAAGNNGSTGYTGSAGTNGTIGVDGYTGSVGFTGSKGDTGLGFAIAKSYLSLSALTADTAPTGIAAGQFAIIETGDVSNADNSKLYLWTGSAYTYVTDLSGAAGITGPAGSTGFTGSASTVAGYTGSFGYTGSVGTTGAVGFTGSTSTVAGYTGSIGFTGSTGAGYTGSAGVGTNLSTSESYLSTGTTSGTGWQKVPINVSKIDEAGWWDNVNRYFKPTLAGWYLVSGRARTNSATLSALAIGKNGAHVQAFGNDINGNQIAIGGSQVVYLNGTTDYVDLRSYANANGVVYTTGTYDTYLQISGPLQAGPTGYTGSTGSGYTGSTGSGYTGSAGTAGAIGYTGSAGTGGSGGGSGSVTYYATRSYTGDGTQTAFTVTAGMTGNSVIVTENGIVQTPVSDYTVSSSTLTFTTAPANNVQIQIREMSASSADPAGNSIYSRTAITATAGQTSFAVAYNVGFLEVYFNGALLNAIDYTATNGSTVVLTDAAVAGDLVEFITYNIVPVTSVPVAMFNSTNLTANLAITAGYSAVSVGPISVADGVSISIADGQKWVIL